MNRIDFMQKLEERLLDLPAAERQEALQYYEDYLNDAGTENEEEVLAALGTPEKLAASIRDGLNESRAEQGEFSENGYRSSSDRSENEMIYRKAPETEGEMFGGAAGESSGCFSGSGQNRREPFGSRYRREERRCSDENGRRAGKNKLSGGMIALIVVLSVLAAPIAIPVLIAAAAVALALIVTVVVVVAAFLLVGVVLVIAGILALFVSFVKLVAVPAGAVVMIGVSLVMIGIGILMTMLLGWIALKLFPAAFRAVVNFVSGIFQKKGGAKK